MSLVNFQTTENVRHKMSDLRHKLHKSTLKYTKMYSVNYKLIYNSIISVIKLQKKMLPDKIPGNRYVTRVSQMSHHHPPEKWHHVGG